MAKFNKNKNRGGSRPDRDSGKGGKPSRGGRDRAGSRDDSRKGDVAKKYVVEQVCESHRLFG